MLFVVTEDFSGAGQVFASSVQDCTQRFLR